MHDRTKAEWGFLKDGGESGARIRSHDWTTTSLGSPSGWPQSLRTALRLMLTTRHPIFIFWGPESLCFFNDAYAQSMGAERRATALGQPGRQVWAEIWEVIGPQIEQVMAGRGATWHENHLIPITRDGKLEDVYWTYSYGPIDEESAPNQVGGALVVVTETTEKVLAEQRTAAELDRQRALLQQMPGFVGVLRGAAHVFDYVNDAYVKVAGNRDFLGRSVRDVFPELQGQGFYELLDEVYTSGQRYTASAVPIRLQGEDEARFLDLLYEPIRNNDGTVSGIFVGGYEVSERVRLESKLRDLNEGLERKVSERTAERDRIWRNSHDMITVIDLNGTLLSVSPSVTDILEWRVDEMLGRKVMEFIHPEDQPPLQNGRLLAERYAKPRLFINRFRHKDGTYRSISWSSGIEDGIIYSHGRDVTVEREQEQALRAAEESLRQAQKMEAVGQLTGGLAHDFNNLLAGITGSLELLRKRVEEGRLADLDRYVGVGLAAARRAAALTHRLLAFSRRQTLEPKVLAVNRLVGDMEELVRRTMGPQIDLEVVGGVGLWNVKADASQLESALLNLCINARDAMPDGGKLTIETANRRVADRTAIGHGIEAGQYVSMCVSDNGVGMPPEVVARAFDPFFTTKPIGMGTGLGLSMIYGFAKQSGGQVRIYSEVGKGTMVCVYLPRHLNGEAHTEPPEQSTQDARATTGQTVLVVDDEPSVRMFVAEVMSGLGYATLEAADGREALQLLQSDVRIDLLVSDVGLPGGMNGRQVADAARIARPDLKVLFITGYAENAVLSHGHLDPGMHVMTKPFELSALARRAKELLQSP